MIKVNQNDTLIDIIWKIKKEKENEIFLDFPFAHCILHDYIALKIIKSQSKDKPLTIITSDFLSRSIWKQLWIRYLINREQDVFEKKSSRKENILRHNFGFFEFLYFETKRLIKYNPIMSFLKKNLSKKKIKEFRKSWIWIASIWILSSILILTFVFYFAVHKTYIYVSPEVSVKTKAKNFYYALEKEETIKDKWDFIQLEKLEIESSMKEIFQSREINYEKTQKARWKVTLINELPESQNIRPKTRLLTPWWIIFYTPEWIKIPPAKVDENWKFIPWTFDTVVEAWVFDKEWVFVWSRWNIKEPQILILPWLVYNKDKIYAKSNSEFIWWWDDYSYIITQKDVDISKEIFEKNLKKKALLEIKEIINNRNKETWKNYSILQVEDSITYNDTVSRLAWEAKIWDTANSFSIEWKTKINGFIYNKDDVIKAMEDLIERNILWETQKLSFVNDKSIRVSNVINYEKDPLNIRATTDIEIWLIYNFENNENTEVKKMKNFIRWTEKQKAKEILQADSKINFVEIENSPFFMSNIANSEENIIIKIKNN